jgi:Flp pilus assembly protein TadG
MNALPLRNQRGAAVVEFAVLALLLVVFVFGIIEFGLLWVQSHYIANAAREGARVASKIPGTAAADIDAREEDAINAAKEYLREFFLYGDKVDDSDFLTIDVTEDDLAGVATPPRVIEVTVTVQSEQIWQPVLWALLNLMPGADFPDDFLTTLTQTGVFVIQQE